MTRAEQYIRENLTEARYSPQSAVLLQHAKTACEIAVLEGQIEVLKTIGGYTIEIEHLESQIKAKEEQ